MIKQRLLPLALAVMTASGCASFPGSDERPSLEGASEQVIDGWNAIPAITQASTGGDINLQSPEALPDSLRQTPVDFSAESTITARDLTFLFASKGIQALLADPELANAGIYLPGYKGTLGNLTDLISEATNLSFRWVGGAVLIDQQKSYIVQIAQNSTIADSIASAISEFGAEDVFASAESGTVSYSASTRDQRKIADYLNRLSMNSALIQVQLAVINVSLSDNRNTGLDWSALSLKLGDLGMVTETVMQEGTAGTLSGLGAGIKFASDNINLTSALNMLSTYGNSRTEQNLTLSTLSGIEVAIDAGDEIPYVSDVSLQVASGGGTLNTVSGFETDVVETGFKTNILPMFNHADRMVTMDVELDLKALKGFRDLTAGANGTVSQPEIQKQVINSIVKLEAGQTVLLGGLIIENYSDNRQSLSFLERLPFGSQSMKNNQSAIFVLLRPTVTVFGGGND